MKRTLLAAVYLLLTILARPQQFGMGCIIDERLGKIPALPSFLSFGAETVPDRYSLKKYCPTPGNQENIGSCVGWATGYGALTMMQAIAHNVTNKQEIDKMAFSGLYIYKSVRTDNCQGGEKDGCGGCGASFLNAFDFIKRNGDVSSRLFDVNATCGGTLTTADRQKALDYRIKDATTLFWVPGEVNNIAATKDYNRVNKVIDQLAKDNPVVIAMWLPVNPYKKWECYFQDNAYFSNGLLRAPANAVPSSAASHAMVIVGYDKVEKTFEIMNSWGTASFADRGFCRISFDDFLKYVPFAGVMHADNPTLPDQQVNLKMELQQYNRVKGAVVYDKNLPVTFNGRYYTAAAPENQLFKLSFSRLPENFYVYVMSVDADKKAQLHFPKENESPLVYSKNLGLLIPQAKVMRFAKPEDNFIILLSRTAIENAQALLTKSVGEPGDLFGNLSRNFGATTPGTGVRFSPSNLGMKIEAGYNKPLLFYINLKRS